jgi:transcriptional regulator with XRE-family HTH domain
MVVGIMTLGNGLRTLREARGWKQTEVARILAVTPGTINKYEHDGRTPDPVTLGRLADLYGATVDQLLGRTKTPIELDPELVRIHHRARELNPSMRQEVLDFIEWARAQQRKKARHERDSSHSPEHGPEVGG